MEVHELLSSPISWLPSTICDFYKKCDKFLKDSGKKNQEWVELIQEFIKRLNNAALECNLFGTSDNWRDCIDNSHLEVLVTVFINGKPKKDKTKYNYMLVSDLLTVIRHKHEHFRDIPEAEKIQLGWSPLPECCTEDQIYAQYWTNLFPNLLPFLWARFCKFSDDAGLSEFYPFSVMRHDENFPCHINGLTEALESALQRQVQIGLLKESFMSPNIQFQIRHMPSEMLSSLLPKASTAVIIAYAYNSLEISWESSSGKGSKTRSQNLKYCGKISNILHNTTLVLLESKESLQTVLSRPKLTSRFIIFMFNTEETNEIVNMFENCLDTKFTKIPVCWEDLDNTTQVNILQSGKFQCQHKRIFLKEIINDIDTEQDMLLQLNGDKLISLLKTETPELFQKCVLLPKPDQYMDQKLHKASELSYGVLDLRSENDVFVLEGYKSCEVNKILGTRGKEFIKIMKRYRGMPKDPHNVVPEILIGHRDLSKESVYHVLNFKPKNIHFFTYGTSKTFLWFRTVGSTSVLKQFSTNFIDSILTEELFLNHILLSNQNVIIICGDSGTGKSSLLASLARKLDKSIVLYSSAKDWVEVLRFQSSKKISKEYLLDNLIRITCSSKFEEVIVKTRLVGEKQLIDFHLMIDNFDKLESYARAQFCRCFEMFKQNFPNMKIYICVTVIENLKPYGEILPKEHFKVAPLMKSDAIDLIVGQWRQAFDKKNLEESFRASNKQLLKMAESILGILFYNKADRMFSSPTLCKMLAKVYTKDALEGNFESVNITCRTCLSVYDSFVKQSFANCLPWNLGNYMKQVLFRNMMDIHTYFAFKALFGKPEAFLFQKKMNMIVESMHELKMDTLKCGLIVGFNPVKFVRPTVAEYFVANFLFDVIAGCSTGFCKHDLEFETILFKGLTATGKDFMYPVLVSILSHKLKNNLPKPVVSEALRSFIEAMYASEIFLYSSNCSLFAAAKYNHKKEIFELVLNYQQPLAELFVLAVADYKLDFVKYVVENRLVNLSNLNKNKLNIFHACCFQSIFFLDRYVCDADIYTDILNLQEEKMDLSKQENPDFPQITQNILLDLFANVNESTVWIEARSSEGLTPLQMLLREADFIHPEFFNWVNFFVEKLSANIHVRDSDNNTLLHVICIRIAEEESAVFQQEEFLAACILCDYLTKLGLSSSEVNNDNDTPLHIAFFVPSEPKKRKRNNYASEAQFETLVSALKPSQSALNTVNKYGFTPLLLALDRISCSVNLITQLVSLGSNVNLNFETYGYTPLHSCVRFWSSHRRNGKSLQIFNYLLSQGANVFAKTCTDRSLLNYAGFSNSIPLVEKLLSFGFSLLEIDKGGNTILHQAVTAGAFKLIKYLVKKEPRLLNCVNNLGYTALVTAIVAKLPKVARELVFLNADVFIVDVLKRSVLHHAIKNNMLELVILLLKKGSDIYAVDMADQCCVSYAVSCENDEITRRVLFHEKRLKNKECYCWLHFHYITAGKVLKQFLFCDPVLLETSRCVVCRSKKEEPFIRSVHCQMKHLVIKYLWFRLSKAEQLHYAENWKQVERIQSLCENYKTSQFWVDVKFADDDGPFQSYVEEGLKCVFQDM